MCDDGLTCAATDVCQVCSDGAEQCACRIDGTCDSGLRCEAGVCLPACDAAAAGTIGCMCRTGGDPACDAGATCRSSVCVECSSMIEGCPCSAGVCTGLVCDAGSCRAARTCDTLSCAAHQECQPSTPERDAQCLPSCEPGWVWDATAGACMELTANCRPGDLQSILQQCTDRNRGCMESGTTAACTGCLAGFLEDEGLCRLAIDCSMIDCDAMHRTCVPPTSTMDATCGACVAGYRVNASGVCEPAGVTCADIAGTCSAQNRTCAESGGTASCTTCIAGYAEDPTTGACVVDEPCSALTCAAEHRVCLEDPGRCTACLAGYVDDPVVGCRLPLTCADTTCTTGQICIEVASGADAQCTGDPCPPLGIWDVYSMGCVTCPSSCTDGTPVPGETGRPDPRTVFVRSDSPGICICETQPGYFHDLTGGAGTSPCDEDGDGWVRQTARSSVETAPGPLRDNARCTIHEARAFTLEGDLGGAHTEAVTPLFLYESLRNDSQAQLDRATAAEVPIYGSRRPVASELNSLTKLCIGPTADHNHNFLADVREYAGATLTVGSGSSSIPTALAPLYTVYTEFSYFAELNSGGFEPDDPTAYDSPPAAGPNVIAGVYRIAERPRAVAGSMGGAPISYGRDDADPAQNYYDSCLRHRDVDFATRADAVGLDFASFVDAGGESVMTHHSQYRCLQLVDDATFGARDAARDRHMVRSADVTAPSEWTVNICSVNGSPAVVSGTPNPDEPRLACTGSSTLPALTVGQVFWGAVNYLHGVTPRSGAMLATSLACGTGGTCPASMTCVGGFCQGRSDIDCASTADCPSGTTCTNNFCRSSTYVRGCIDECTEQSFLPAADRCPGLGTPGIACEADAANFGQLQCGCGRNYGGASCEIGCPTGELMLDASYDISPRTGYWMCGHFAASDGALMSGGGYTLSGEVPVHAADGTAMTGGGYTLSAR